MAETDYPAMWRKLWEPIREKYGIPHDGAMNPDDYRAAIRETLHAYLLEIYREEVRKQYSGIPTFDIDPLVLRVVSLHHWKIDEAAALNNQQLTIALADELNHFHLPEVAARWAFGQAQESTYQDLEFVMAHSSQALREEMKRQYY